MVMRIVVKTQSKPELIFRLGNVVRERGRGATFGREACRAVKCETCQLDARGDRCPTISSCADIFTYFHDVVSFEKAEATLLRSGRACRLRGTAQRAAAFSILCCLVFSGCGHLSRYEFLLRHFCLIQGGDGEILELDSIFADMPRENTGERHLNGRERYALLIDLLDKKIRTVVAGYDKLSRHDTLRNAFQILYSVGSLAFGAGDRTSGAAE